MLRNACAIINAITIDNGTNHSSMLFSIQNFRLSEAQFLESSNQSPRSLGINPDLVIIHNISLPPGKYGGGHIAKLFNNTLNPRDHPYFEEIHLLKVSSHLLIERDGSVTQFVPFNQKAWHAGESAYSGRDNCNDFSIGIELEGTDFEPFTDIQYAALVDITKLLLINYPSLNHERIVGHSDVAPGRKTDPGPFFDWTRYKSAVTEK